MDGIDTSSVVELRDRTLISVMTLACIGAGLCATSIPAYLEASGTLDGGHKSLASARLKALSMEASRGIVSDANARQILMIFDSCFSGTVFTARSPTRSQDRLSEDDVIRLLKQPAREFITAGDIQEKSFTAASGKCIGGEGRSLRS